MPIPDSLDLTADPAELTATLVDIPSVSRDEQPLADLIENALRTLPHLRVERNGNAVLARTDLGRPTRVMLAGHLDTVPIADNVPSRRDGDTLHGCGTTDMKSGDAMLLHIAATLPEPSRDLTFVFYDCEEIDNESNGLTRIEREMRDWLDADLAVLGEPTNGNVEAGCQGTAAVEIALAGKRSHTARAWMGVNAIHAAAPVLDRLAEYPGRDVDIDGQYPNFEDFGDMVMTGNGGTGYVRVDWFTPDGLDTWGDGRLFVLGSEGYIELRKYTNVASGLKGGNHLYVVDKQQARYIDCGKVTLPFGPQFVADVVERTEVAQNQEQALLAAELVLQAQKIATRPIVA